MNNPFPGMNPYLESRWYDVHTGLVAYASDQLNQRLPDDLVASREERIAVENDQIAVAEAYRPDIRVEKTPGPWRPTAEPGGTLTESAVRLVAAEPATERFVKITEVGTRRIVTVIEVLSPSNKRSPGLRVYRKKRHQLLAADVNVVEIDLVRKGNWEALLIPQYCPPSRLTPYRATIRFPRDPLAAYLYPFTLQKPLPQLPIPLREGDAPIFLDLQPLIDSVYRLGRYEKVLDYTKPPPEPALNPEDLAWCEELLTAANLRTPNP